MGMRVDGLQTTMPAGAFFLKACWMQWVKSFQAYVFARMPIDGISSESIYGELVNKLDADIMPADALHLRTILPHPHAKFRSPLQCNSW
jgi:hypothetical protein